MLSSSLALLLATTAVSATPRPRGAAADACTQIADAISSSSAIFYPGTEGYTDDIEHWATSSTQDATCSVEPGTAEDVAAILKVIGSTKTPFAVKGGGHATNQGFSSTTGVQIAMSRFKDIKLSDDKKTVDVGAGSIWDEVYLALNGTGVNAPGGRVPGVGVAGFSLGGGYTFQTSQYGLAIDNIASYELVLPNGTVTTVLPGDDLFFALRGAFNNYGIVTKFTFVTHPQTDVYGGLIQISGEYFDDVTKAIASFSNDNTDTKASILPAYQYSNGTSYSTITVYYDAPTAPDNAFFGLLDIPRTISDIKTRSYYDLLEAQLPIAPIAPGVTAKYASVNVLQYTPTLLETFKELAVSYGQDLAANDSTFLSSFYVEPFDESLFSHGTDSAYPPDRSRPLRPSNIFFSFADDSLYDFFHAKQNEAADKVRAAADAEGQNVGDAFQYSNYGLEEVTAEQLFGANVPRLQAIQAAVDPNGVMKLAGGYKV
ncbi:FAD-binding domain-containing protein [Peniophora sp. CONT]|nr:FAD-binding domain-containing protein [Peniophora sp. CONT]